ncbi:L-carnitine/gamma-butyrobetaine antiporter [Desulfosporosinus sp.]|uniref:L-carnitine/gamma-butyrobetaine antiporter n=1 Tax=Desulfosporosinus sp. TaxID=157907 RepID=UPI00231D688E|nr:L-carnitine/gamma-butyrobetaine antiporter [Desulfosporosinus sp.]MDA8220992.1 L-carnitine/gamma-butyrobetaine antiporter [Desulfitobacterium hafniense]
MGSVQKKKIDWAVFVPPIIMIITFCLWIVFDPKGAGIALNKAYSFVTVTLGWFFEWYAVVLFGLFIYFVVGPYSKKKLGEGDPEFKTSTWWGMMFTTNAGVGVLFWATMESFWTFQAGPFGSESLSPEAARWAVAYPMFHWGPMAWGMYTVFGLAFAYLFWVKKINVARPSIACEPLIGSRLANGWLGKAIDIFYMFGLIGGAATALGANTPVVAELFSKVIGINRTLTLDTVLLISWAIFIAVVVYIGLNKGIKVLSDFRIVFSFVVIGIILVFGPTQFILDTTTDSIGHLLQNFVQMSFNLDPHTPSTFPQDWTIFYWAWYLTFLIPTGIYFARISRGRTVREFAIASVAASTIGSWIFFGVFSSQMLDTFNKGLVPIADILQNGGPAKAAVEIWATLPFSPVLLVMLAILAYISMATLVNSSIYTISMGSMKELSGEDEPPGWVRIFWALAMGALIVAIISLNQFKPIQTLTVVAAVPMIPITIMVLLSFLKSIKKDWN